MPTTSSRRPLLLLPSILSSIRVLTNESALHIRWPKHWSFSVSPSNECSGLISFRLDWFDFFAVQGTLKSLLQHLYCDSLLSLLSDFFLEHSPSDSHGSVSQLNFRSMAGLPRRPASSSPPPASEPALSPCVLSGLYLPPYTWWQEGSPLTGILARFMIMLLRSISATFRR